MEHMCRMASILDYIGVTSLHLCSCCGMLPELICFVLDSEFVHG